MLVWFVDIPYTMATDSREISFGLFFGVGDVISVRIRGLNTGDRSCALGQDMEEPMVDCSMTLCGF